MSKINNYIRNNKLNVATYIISFIGIVIYIIGVTTLKNTGTTLKEILSMSANYVTILSCIIVLVQLVAFFSDSRHKEYRRRKEVALDIAKQYAEISMSNMSFIQNVLSTYYDKNNVLLLEKIIAKEEIHSDRFIKSSLEKHSSFDEYSKVFLSGNNEIPLEIIATQSMIYSDILNLECILHLPEDTQKTMANLKFKVLVYDTMNTIEYFAMAVNQNVAESEMLFSSLHQTFIKFIHYMYPVICMYNIESERFYKNTIELYRNWFNEKNEIEENHKKTICKAQNKTDKQYAKGKPL
ncbi:MAG: hypothetical protein IKY78_10815 [Clostridia bacterium]|nr:hypothetical protein [Clostridia bacterium]